MYHACTDLLCPPLVKHKAVGKVRETYVMSKGSVTTWAQLKRIIWRDYAAVDMYLAAELALI